MTLKIIQKAHYDPEDYSKAHPPTLKIIQKAAFDKSVLEVFRTNEGWILGKINQRQRRELYLVFHGG